MSKLTRHIVVSVHPVTGDRLYLVKNYGVCWTDGTKKVKLYKRKGDATRSLNDAARGNGPQYVVLGGSDVRNQMKPEARRKALEAAKVIEVEMGPSGFGRGRVLGQMHKALDLLLRVSVSGGVNDPELAQELALQLPDLWAFKANMTNTLTE